MELSPEKLTAEQLKNLSPQQLAELQKQNCIFCHIASGKVQSKIIYEDDICVAVLDINPCNPGHVLLFTKEHYSIMPQIPEDILNHLSKITKRISNSALRSLKAEGTNIFAANGVAAGQKAPHFMFHIVPRKENDGLTIFNFEKYKNENTEQLTENISARLSGKTNVASGQTNASSGKINIADSKKNNSVIKEKTDNIQSDIQEDRREENKEETQQENQAETHASEKIDDADDGNTELDLDTIAKFITNGGQND